ALLPRARFRRGRARGPEPLGPWRRGVIRVEAEVQDVALRDAHVLEELPGSVRCAARLLPAQGARELEQRLHERRVRAAALQHGDERPALLGAVTAMTGVGAGHGRRESSLAGGGRSGVICRIGGLCGARGFQNKRGGAEGDAEDAGKETGPPDRQLSGTRSPGGRTLLRVLRVFPPRPPRFFWKAFATR